MTEDDAAQAVYEYVHTLGSVGDVVKTAIYPHLMSRFGFDATEARKWRDSASRQLKAEGYIQRENVRGNLRILA